MRKVWLGLSLAALVVLPFLGSPAEANQEMHPGARLFFPLWDVSTPNRLTFIVVTREARREGSSISSVSVGTLSGGGFVFIDRWKVQGTPGNCIPRGAGGSSANVNRTDLTTPGNPVVFVDDLHFEFYGKNCANADEIVHMSCADIDLFLLAAPNNAQGFRPRTAFDSVASEGRGALDVHLIVNGSGLQPEKRKDDGGDEDGPGHAADNVHPASMDNSLMGHAIIADLAEGWAATYPAAAARTTSCGACAAIDSGTAVGYENYPMEVFLPFALADPFAAVPSGAAGFPLRNILSLWAPPILPNPALFPAGDMQVQFIWWDGRERAFTRSEGGHAIIAPLGGAAIAGLDIPIDGGRFNAANFVCGLGPAGNLNAGQAENDGFPRAGTDSTACGAPLPLGDFDHDSDNFESSGDSDQSGHSIQSSTPIAWWRFTLQREPLATLNVPNQESFFSEDTGHSGRGLVGVVLSNTVGASSNGVGDATRLWHKGPCEKSQGNTVYGPPHTRTNGFGIRGQHLALFNAFTFPVQRDLCEEEGINID